MAMKQATRTNQAISLKGSTKIVTEFFEYSVNRQVVLPFTRSRPGKLIVSFAFTGSTASCIRGTYTLPMIFGQSLIQAKVSSPFVAKLGYFATGNVYRMVKKYGLPMLITADEELKAYLETILKQVHEWLMQKTITRLVLAITSKETLETVERWQFDIITEDENGTGESSGSAATSGKPKEKTEKEVQVEIREIMKQITASVTFLPVLEEECSFTLLAYTSTQDPLPLPEKWNDADPHLIDKGKVEQVRLRSFSTNVHKMEAMVAYRVGE